VKMSSAHMHGGSSSVQDTAADCARVGHLYRSIETARPHATRSKCVATFRLLRRPVDRQNWSMPAHNNSIDSHTHTHTHIPSPKAHKSIAAVRSGSADDRVLSVTVHRLRVSRLLYDCSSWCQILSDSMRHGARVQRIVWETATNRGQLHCVTIRIYRGLQHNGAFYFYFRFSGLYTVGKITTSSTGWRRHIF